MPWSDNFNQILGGAAGGGLSAGRYASLAEVLAGAAMGSSRAMQEQEELRQRQAEFEERRRQEEEDRKLRAQEIQIRLRSAQQQAEAQARQDAAGRAMDQFQTEHHDPNFMGPLQNTPPDAAFAEPGDRAKFFAGQDTAQAAAETDRKKIDFIIANGMSPGPDSKSNDDIIKKITMKQFGGEGGLTPYQEHQIARQDEQDQQKEDDDWREEFTGDLASKRFDTRDRAATSAWDKEFEDNRRWLSTVETTKEMDPQSIEDQAKAMTEEKLGERPYQARSNPAKKAVPGFTGKLPPSGAKVASPTGAAAPPKVTGSPALRKSSDIGAAVDAEIPNLPPQLKAQVKARIAKAVLAKEVTLEEALATLRAQYGSFTAPAGL